MLVSKADGSNTTDHHRDALMAEGVDPQALYEDRASGKEDCPDFAACLKSLRHGDGRVVRKLHRLGRDLHHLVNIVHDLTQRGVELKVLTGQGAAIDATAASCKLVFGIFDGRRSSLPPSALWGTASWSPGRVRPSARGPV